MISDVFMISTILIYQYSDFNSYSIGIVDVSHDSWYWYCYCHPFFIFIFILIFILIDDDSHPNW